MCIVSQSNPLTDGRELDKRQESWGKDIGKTQERHLKYVCHILGISRPKTCRKHL